MNKKVLIISSSPCKDGNSDLLCDQFAKGAKEAGHTVEKVSLADKEIGYCIACDICQNGTCPQQDDVPGILKKMLAADVIALATPVYFYSMCAQLKALIDRSVAIYSRLTEKHLYYIITMADTNQEMLRGTLEALRGALYCYEGSVEAGVICAFGVYGKREVQKLPIMEEAYQAGLHC